MSGDQLDRLEVSGAAAKAVPTARAPNAEQVSAVLECWAAVARRIAITGGIFHAVLLLMVRVWLSQAIFVHQIISRMRQ
jgi:hypothetical protein